MNRRQLLESLLVERFTAVPKPAVEPVPRPSWVTLRELQEALRTRRDCDEREAG